jgi:hypothetical protein
MKIERLVLVLVLVIGCSTSGSGLSSRQPDAAMDSAAVAQPDTLAKAPDSVDSLPCNGACGAGTTCVTNVCMVTVGPEPKTGAEPQQGPAPAGKEPGPEPQMAPEPQHLDGGITPPPGPEPQQGAEPQQGPEPGPEPQQRPDSSVPDTTTLCGGAGQACCTGRVCNNGGTCTITGCVHPTRWRSRN